MFKFLASDLPVFLNVDIETYQIVLSVYFLLFFVGISFVFNIEHLVRISVQRIVFFKLTGNGSPVVTHPTNLNFALGP
jgi:hypothetical protein